ncbi:MAG: hypothetical protein ACM30H_02575 [Clostridia bacterium]
MQNRRVAFAVYVGTCCAAILLAPTIVGALEPAPAAQPKAGSASTGASASPSTGASAAARSEPQPAAQGVRSFDDCDRNGDGWLDKSEAGGVPGLSANFERADVDGDGRLSRQEFEKALPLLQSQKN